MKVLITGAAGQLGQALLANKPKHFDVVGLNRQQLDITQPNSIQQALKEHQPYIVINTAAFTQVDLAEVEPELAFAVNAQGIENLAQVCMEEDIRLIHISTDYVFSGAAKTPISVDDVPSPINQYGKSKLAGEQLLQSIMPKQALIVRTSALYSNIGNNFYQTMKSLMFQGQDIQVVNDQITVPTQASWLAQWLWQFLEQPQAGIYHAVQGKARSWYEFACDIQQELLEKGELRQPVEIQPISTDEYIKDQNRVVADRPKYSVLLG